MRLELRAGGRRVLDRGVVDQMPGGKCTSGARNHQRGDGDDRRRSWKFRHGGFVSTEARMPSKYHRSDRTTNAGPRPHRVRGTARRNQEPSARPIIGRLSDAKVGEIVGGLAVAFPAWPVPREPAMLNGRRSANASVKQPGATARRGTLRPTGRARTHPRTAPCVRRMPARTQRAAMRDALASHRPAIPKGSVRVKRGWRCVRCRADDVVRGGPSPATTMSRRYGDVTDISSQ
jgi:hypothetical protein